MEQVWFSNLRNILEILYFASGPALVVVTIIALNQIKIAKDDIRIRSQREASQLTISQCEKYQHEIIPLMVEIYKFENENKVPKYMGKIGDFLNDDLTKDPKWFSLWVSKPKEINQRWINLINALESFSICFTMGIADEGMAFSIAGKIFCDNVKDLYPYIAIFRTKGNVRLQFEHIVTLYKIWSPRLQKYNYEEQLIELQSNINSIKDDTIKPVGTDI